MTVPLIAGLECPPGKIWTYGQARISNLGNSAFINAIVVGADVWK